MNETIGSRIQKYRKAKGMTQEELAAKMGVSSQAVSKWENDVSCPDISLLPKLCDILGITADELLTGKGNEVKMLPADQRKSLEELTMRVNILSAAGDKVRVNLPMTLVKAALEMGVEITPSITGSDITKNLDISKILELAERGLLGKLVEIESAGGDTLEVVVE